MRDDLSPPADPNWDPRIRPTRADDPSEQQTQWLPRDQPDPGGWMPPDERAPIARPWQPPVTPPAPGRTNANTSPHPMAIASLISGVIALVFGLICTMPIPGILAVIFGFVALSQLRNRPTQPSKGLAIAGIIMGGLSLLWFVLWVIWMIFAIAFG
ncbi:MAG TPA: DUF4190 domain-containing protein [Pyrinomonadaceae bacterium]|nr:DUF4190 domain-containing protein [Pyrinomonadaceae bacterium]